MTQLTVVTGCAGFIGSHLCERLVAEGGRVVGIDSFTDYYARADKEANLSALRDEPQFDLVEADLVEADLVRLFEPASTVFHLAAQPGVRGSFGETFEIYVRENVLATQRVFEGAIAAGVPRVVWASSSSVYGDAEAYPCSERSPTVPRSPYGATKRACEDIARIYHSSLLRTVGLRYFTVYGPRQRPDMAMRRLCEALEHEEVFPLYGDGSQSRDFTYVADAVDATVRAARAEAPPALLNVGGGEEATLAQVIAVLEQLAGERLRLDVRGPGAGDVWRTAADTTLARHELGWRPKASLTEGLRAQLEWVRERTSALEPA